MAKCEGGQLERLNAEPISGEDVEVIPDDANVILIWMCPKIVVPPNHPF